MNSTAAIAVEPPSVSPEPATNDLQPPGSQRQTLTSRTLGGRRYSARRELQTSNGSVRERRAAAQDSSHAEAFYFQKQMQAQTPMVIHLEDGERIEGCIEWYDTHVIKVRRTNRQRTLIFKSSIKYLHKASEANGNGH